MRTPRKPRKKRRTGSHGRAALEKQRSAKGRARWFWLAAILVWLTASVVILRDMGPRPLLSIQGSKADPTDSAQVARGEILYEGHCATCHGANLEGQPDWRNSLPDGRYPAPPHDETGHTWHHDDDLLFQVTKNGGKNTARGWVTGMPSFHETLTDDEIWAVLAFIKSRWPKEIQEQQANLNRS